MKTPSLPRQLSRRQSSGRESSGRESSELSGPTRVDLIDAGALTAMLMISLWTFQSSYGGVVFMIVGLVSVLAGIVLAWVSYNKKWPGLVVAACALIVYVLLGTWLALRQYAFLGVIPTPKSMLETLTSSVTAWKELITTAPPVGSTGDLMILPVFLGFFGGLLGYTAARRLKYAAPVLIAPLVVTGLGIAVGTNTPVSLIINGLALGLVMVGWVSWRESLRRPTVAGAHRNYRRLAAAGLMLGVAGLLGFMLSSRLPGDDGTRSIWRQTVTPPFDPRIYPSPLAGYRDYVKPGYDANNKPNPADVIFSIEGLPKDVPVRLATMDSYDGLVWQVSGGDPNDPSLQDSGSFERIGTQLAPDVDGREATVTVTIGKYNDVWIPDVGEVISLKFEGSSQGPARDRELANSFRYNRATDTAATPLKLETGDRYVMRVRLPNALENFTGQQIEPTVPRLGSTRSVGEVTQKLAGPDVLVVNDSGERIDKIRELMVKNGAYSDGDRLAGQTIVSAGHSDARLSAFVAGFPEAAFIGNAEQYSASFALLFRDLGNVPTRVVMGFRPQASSESGAVDVVQTDADAWVEVPVKGLGWVAVFPTPPRDQLSRSSSTTQQPDPDYRTQNPPPPPLVDPEFDQPAKATGKATNPTRKPEEAKENKPADDSPGFFSSPTVRRAAMAMSPFLVLLVLAVAIIVVKLTRRRRRRSRGATHQRIANGWREVTDLSTDLGRPVPPANTRREAAAVVGSSSVALAERTDAAIWSGAELSDADVDAYWAELKETLRSMRSNVGFWQRVRSHVSIQSLKRQRKGPA